MNTVSIEIFVGRRVSVLFKLKKTAFSKKPGCGFFPRIKKIRLRPFRRGHITGGAENARKNYLSLHRMQKQKLQQ